jgi:hypothetical protein
MAEAPPLPREQLLVFGFEPGASFQGQLVGALERIEVGGAMRILEAVFVMRDADTGELSATSVRGDGTGGIAGTLVGFRLDAADRRRATERALSDRTKGMPAETLRELGGAIEPGAALAANLVQHRWALALDDAVSRTGGERLVNELVDAERIEELAGDLLAAAARHSDPG